MEEVSIKRINELARKSKTPEGLTAEEKEEQAALRTAYVLAIRRNLRGQLEQIDLKNPDGSITSVKEMHEKKYGAHEYPRETGTEACPSDMEEKEYPSDPGEEKQ